MGCAMPMPPINWRPDCRSNVCVSRLRRAWEGGALPRVRDRAEVDRVLKALMASAWLVYSKPALARTETVVDYLGRYSHRIALSDSRLLDFDGESVELSYKDYRDGDRRKVMPLSGEELIRRFLLHVLPKGFMRVRHLGFLANRCRARRLAQIRTALAAPHRPPAACGCARPAHRKASTLALTAPPRNPCGTTWMPGLRPTHQRPRPNQPPGDGRRPRSQGYNPLSLKKALPIPGTVPGSD